MKNEWLNRRIVRCREEWFWDYRHGTSREIGPDLYEEVGMAHLVSGDPNPENIWIGYSYVDSGCGGDLVPSRLLPGVRHGDPVYTRYRPGPLGPNIVYARFLTEKEKAMARRNSRYPTDR